MTGQIELAVVVVSSFLFQAALLGLRSAVRIQGVTVLLVVLFLDTARRGLCTRGTSGTLGFACNTRRTFAIARAATTTATAATTTRGFACAWLATFARFACRQRTFTGVFVFGQEVRFRVIRLVDRGP